MLDWLMDVPPLALAALVFLLRIIDVSLGTVRTISVVHGRVKLSVLVGFLEVLVWVTAVASVLQRASESPIVMLAYAFGFAAGNATGIMLERRLAMGDVVLRCFTSTGVPRLEFLFRQKSRRVTAFSGRQDDLAMTLYYAICRRRDARALVQAAREIDPHLYYSIDPLHEFSAELASPLPHPTGWRSPFQKK